MAKRSKQVRKRVLMSALAFTLLFVGLYTFFGNNGLMEIMRRKQMKGEIEQSLVAVKKDNLRLRSKIWALKNQMLEVERIAREKLFLIKPGETVFLVKE